MAERLSFTKKLIEVRVTLRAGSFGGRGNTKVIYGVPTKAKIEKTGPPDFCKATVECAGLLYEDLEQLITLAFKPLKTAKNVIEINVGAEGDDALNLAFKGEITNASADFNSAPDIWLKMECSAGYYGAVTAQGPTAIKGNQPVSSFIESQAKAMGYAFRNDGVTAQVNNAIFQGSPLEQARAAAREIGAEMWIDDGTLVLSPAGGGQSSKAVKLTKDTGMLGYPVMTNEGLDITALYNPDFQLGGLVQVESVVPKASGVWRIVKLSHELAAFDPSGGPWESKLSCFPADGSGKKNTGKK